MKITCSTASEQQGKKMEKSVTLELPDNAFEPAAGDESAKPETTLREMIREVFDGLK